MGRRHVPAFIADLQAIRSKKPTLKQGLLACTGDVRSYSSSQPSSHIIAPDDEAISSVSAAKREIAASLPTQLPSDYNRSSSPSSARRPAGPSTLAVPPPSVLGKKMTPAMRAAQAKHEAEEAQRAALRAALPKPAPVAAAPRPAAPSSPRPAAAAPRPSAPSAPKPAAKPVSGAPAAKARPACPFGAACYRQNPVHRVDQSHPGDEDYKAAPAAAASKPKAPAKRRDDDEMDDDEDEYDDAPSSKRAAPTSRAARKKKISYKEANDSEDEFEEPENTQDRDFIAPEDEEEEPGESDDEWGGQQQAKSKKRGQKRKAGSDEDEDDEEYVDRGAKDEDDDGEEEELLEEELPKCPYGAGCVRKNPAHFKENRHPHVDLDMKPKVAAAATSAAKAPAATKRETPPAKKPKVESQPPPAYEAREEKKPAAAAPARPSAAAVIAASNSRPAPAAPAPAALGAGGLPTVFTGLEAVLYEPLSEVNRKLITRFWRAYDGDLADSVSSTTTHVIADAPPDETLKEMLRKNSSLCIVKSQWALECIKTKSLVAEAPYLRDAELK